MLPVVDKWGTYFGAHPPSAEIIVYVEDGLIARVTLDEAPLLQWADEWAAEQRASAASGATGATGATSEPYDYHQTWI